MTSLLEEIMRRNENKEPFLELYTGGAIKESYYFEIGKTNAPDFFRKHFSNELAECTGKKKKIIERLMKSQAHTRCMYFRTDSSSTATYDKIFTDYISLDFKAYAFWFDDHKAKLCFDEAYTNAVIHGNNAGEDSCYEEEKCNLPRPANLEENRKKPVEIEFIINHDYYALRVTDVGEGLDKSKVQLGKDGDIMALSGKGLFLIKSLTDCMVFTKQDNPQKFSISMVKFKE
jgi:anti-sigma regulatory factor (Ser/Thr protein kinase)